MTYKLPSLTVVSLFLAVCQLAIAVETVPAESGNALILEAIESLGNQPALEAKVRQRATVFGQLLAGAGLYVQARDGDRLLVRFEFKIQVADRNLSVLQVNDGSTLWIQRDLGQLQSQAYVDLRRLREAQKGESGTMNPANLAARGSPLVVGGLGQVLKSLARNFDFDRPVEGETSGLPIWEVTGEWKKERLVLLLPDQRGRIEAGESVDLAQLPPHLPSTVKLTLGRDRNFPLFPYRIEYGRLQPVPLVTGAVSAKPADSVVRPLVTMELYEVRRRTDLTLDLFRYSPGDQKVEDQTEIFLRQLGPFEEADKSAAGR